MEEKTDKTIDAEAPEIPVHQAQPLVTIQVSPAKHACLSLLKQA